MRTLFFRGRYRRVVVAAVLLTGLGCAAAPRSRPAPDKAAETFAADTTTPNRDLSPLFSHIWRIAKAPASPPFGSIWIFLSNGTLLETSCVETYRIATWTVEKDSPRTLRVVEDRQPAFSANILELTNSMLRVRKRLARGNETQDVTLTAVENEFVCPDIRQ